MLMFTGDAVPKALQVVDETYKRFKHLEDVKELTDPTIPDKIITHSERIYNEYRNINKDSI
jgi:hypothetical protein